MLYGLIYYEVAKEVGKTIGPFVKIVDWNKKERIKAK